MQKIALFLATMIVLMTGCQQSISTDYDKLDLASVSGNVKLDGQSLADAYIIFEGQDLTYSYGKTDSSGNYFLRLNTEKNGILPGSKKVKIRLSGAFGAEGASLNGSQAGEGSTSEGDSEEDGEGEGEEGQAKSRKPPTTSKSELPETYHKKSHLTVEVASGSQTINFNLKSDGSTKGAMQ